MSAVLLWTTILLIIGIANLPLTLWWAKPLYGKGAAVSSLFGTLLLSLTAWTLSYLHVLPNTYASLLFLLIVLISVNTALLRGSQEIQQEFKHSFAKAVKMQLLFFIPFFAWILLRGFNPAIDNFEKFMDMNFVSGVFRARFLPATDPWFAGQPINYYYFGHFIAATLSKLGGISPAIGYNFAVATVFGWSWSAAFTLCVTLHRYIQPQAQRLWLTGVLGACLTTLGGTLYTASFLLEKQTQHFWFYYSIRLIPKAIHEMPGYSFVVSDLHAHLTNIPHILLLLLSVILIVWSIAQKEQALRVYISSIITGGLLGIIFMTSAWDLPMYLGWTGISIALAYFNTEKKVIPAIRKSVIVGSVIACSLLLTILPFFSHFDRSIAQGFGFVHSHTEVKHLATLWFPQFFVLGTCVLLFWKKKFTQYNHFWVMQLLFIGGWACVLLLVPEVIYIKDIYGADMHRLNTILKFYYQAYILFAVVLAIGVRLCFATLKKKIWLAWKLLTLFFIVCMLAYPFQIIPNYYQYFSQFQGWDGTTFMNFELKADRPAIIWLNKEIIGQPVLIEAAGDSYTQYNRISTFTGLPTVQGWFVHEWLWRGSYDKPQQRTKDVETFYQTPVAEQRQEIITTYNIEYIYIGELERRKYPLLQQAALKMLGETMYEHNGVEIIKIKK